MIHRNLPYGFLRGQPLNTVFNKRNFKFYDFLILKRETNDIVFSLDKIREQMRSKMENISEKITEEGGQFRMLIPNSITWTLFQSALINTMTCMEKLPLRSFSNL